MSAAPGLPVRPNAPLPQAQAAVVDAYRRGRLDEALSRARALTDAFPGHPFGWRALGAMLREQQRYGEALEPLRQAARLADDAEAHNDLGVVLHEIGRFDEAMSSFAAALDRNPQFAPALANSGRLLHAQGRLAEAETRLHAALALRADLSEAHNTLAAVLLESGRAAAAESACRQAIALKPDYAEAHTLLGSILSNSGRLSEADRCFGRALELRPDDPVAFSNRLFNRCYSAQGTPLDALALAREYGRRIAARTKHRYAEWLAPAAPARLRIGLVSGDLRRHPVGRFLLAPLGLLDPSRIEVYAYPTQPGEDALTQRIRARCAAWRPLFGLDDAAAAAAIHADGIHVLIDLAGHTAHNRLPVFACRPAPVQATWLGYSGTTGLAEIDYLIADPTVAPIGADDQFSETVWRLPATYLCFEPPDAAPPVAALPALAGGRFTFGCLNNLSKIGDAVVALWARILHAVPGSRLLLKAKQLSDAETVERTMRRFAGHGIDPERLLLLGRTPSLAEHFAVYHRIDVALDPFPYNGTTTSVESLWMGVPFVALRGDRFLSRVGESIAGNAGLCDWIAADESDYVARAVAAAGNLSALASLRARLRQQVLASPLLDAARFACDLEAALWGMWHRRGAGASA